MIRMAIRASVAAALIVIVGTCLPAGAAGGPNTLPPIKHIFVIVLENEDYATSFGDPTADPYLARTLPAEGALLTRYYAIGHNSLDNYLAMISGVAPDAQTQNDCPIYANFVLSGWIDQTGQPVGSGCVYPAAQTVGNQLSAKGLTWKGYMQDMGNDPAREAPVCAHPALGSSDETQDAVAGDGYITHHDPFVYFHAIIDDRSYCDAHVVPLGSPSGALPAHVPAGTTGLATDLKKAATTPNFSFIVPNACNDGHDYPCVNQRSGASALADIDAFLSTWVPLITRSRAFRENGLLVITFDESEGAQSDSSSCCGEMPGPNAQLPGITGPGGGRIGAVLLSPFIRGGTVSRTPYNDYSLLASMENIFGLPRLGYAATTTSTFGDDIFDR